ncbi:MAG TPA: FHA domain-containing protein [Roseiflexaceae bacterium]|nr:FHA domain-containing protein [Roseiflexaceae bacterium]
MAPGTLTITYDDGRQETRPLDQPTVRIGRAAENDLRLAGADIAELHAEILNDPTGCQVIDLGSPAGTHVDGERITPYLPHPLADGALVTIGAVRIVFHTAGRGARAGITPVVVERPDPLLESLLTQPPVAPPPRPAARPPPPRGAAPPPRQAADPVIPPPPAPPPRPEANIGLVVAPAELNLKLPGRVNARIRLVNRAAFVDQVTLSIEGLPPGAVISPEIHQLLPGQSAEAELIISPPRAPASLAGLHEFQIVAVSGERPDMRFTAAGRLTIAPFSDFRFTLIEPRIVTAWFIGRYRLQIENLGNAPQPFTFEARNDEAAFRFRFNPEPLLVAPGERTESILTARLRAGRILAEPAIYPFKVRAAPADNSLPAQNADGRLVQRPPLPLFLLRLLTVLTVLALVAGCGFVALPRSIDFVLSRLAVPGRATTSRPTPTPTPPLATAEIIRETVVVTETVVVAVPAEPAVIVPTVVVTPPPAPTIVVTPEIITVTETPRMPDRAVVFNQINGVPVGMRQPIGGNEYAAHGVGICMYRELPTGMVGVDTAPNDPPANAAGLTIAVRDEPDPVPPGTPLRYTVDLWNDIPGRSFLALGVTVRLPAGSTPAQPTDSRCSVQPDGTLVCGVNAFGSNNHEVLLITITPGQAGLASADFELVALYRESGDPPADPPRRTQLTIRANTTVPAPATGLADCGYTSLPLVREAAARRNPPTRIIQSQPVIYPPPAGSLQSTRTVLTADDGDQRFVNDTIAVLHLQQPAVEARVHVWFPGPPGNFYRALAFDAAGQLVGLFRTDQLGAPGEYTLILRSPERPIALIAVQSLAFSDYDSSTAQSSGGVYLTGVELLNPR